MANNRMYLACRICLENSETTLDECWLYLAKYYPSTGWYLPTDGIDERVTKFLEAHQHGTMFGEYFALAYETMTPEGQDKADILKILAEGMPN